jgi:arylsulfatase A-like enzyme
MKRLTTFFFLTFSCVALIAASQVKPNIIFILTDDLGYTDLGCYGATQIKTPNLDGMAREGTRFTDFYAAACVCTPTRAAFLTGCYPKRVGLHVAVLPTKSQRGLHPDEVTIAEVLRGQGYATACIGKWHLGEAPELLPTAQGFDSYFGMAGPNHGASDLYRAIQVIEEKTNVVQSQLTQRYTREAVDFIRQSKDRPFFLYFAHGAPHIPWYASEAFKGKSAAGLYGDMVEEIDWSVGQVLATVKELMLDERTLVVFTSDNGPWGYAAPPLHGGKGSTWDAGQRVPCIVRWPGRIPPQSVSREMAVIFDWAPTFASLAGGAMPSDRKIDGRDIWPLVSARSGAKSPHDSFVYYSREGLPSAIRSGKWKLHVVAPVEKWFGKLPPEALLSTKPAEPPPWLYDLESDVSETRNVAAANPDVVQRLKAMLEETDKTLEREARPIFTKPGTEAANQTPANGKRGKKKVN